MFSWKKKAIFFLLDFSLFYFFDDSLTIQTNTEQYNITSPSFFYSIWSIHPWMSALRYNRLSVCRLTFFHTISNLRKVCSWYRSNLPAISNVDFKDSILWSRNVGNSVFLSNAFKMSSKWKLSSSGSDRSDPWEFFVGHKWECTKAVQSFEESCKEKKIRKKKVGKFLQKKKITTVTYFLL